ncbi:MAG: hypothetical protein O2V44_08365 [Candidatus Bathyarchaeota archaeon]|nr:hypothetical protein [Candidatus Bathyarchaeota archaeon]
MLNYGQGLCLKKTLEIVLPVELIDVMDKTVELVGFRSRETLAEVAIRRFLDWYQVLLKSANQLSTAR